MPDPPETADQERTDSSPPSPPAEGEPEASTATAPGPAPEAAPDAAPGSPSGATDPAPAPAAAAPEDALRDDPEPAEDGRATVLVVDDREVHRRRTVAQLAGRGWRVLEAADGSRATLIILDAGIDCLLVSGLLRGRPSEGTVRGAAAIRRGHPLPFSIHVLTDTEEGRLPDRLLEAGADDVIARGGGPDAMIRRLRLGLAYRALLRENRELRERLDGKQPGSPALAPPPPSL